MLNHKGTSSYWIGLTDQIHEGQWRWIDTGDVTTTDFWHSGLHDNEKANCANLDVHNGERMPWYADFCSGSRRFLCEKP